MLPDRIELSTSPLPRECSTTELRQQRDSRNRPEGRDQARAVLATRSPHAQARLAGFSGKDAGAMHQNGAKDIRIGPKSLIQPPIPVLCRQESPERTRLRPQLPIRAGDGKMRGTYRLRRNRLLAFASRTPIVPPVKDDRSRGMTEQTRKPSPKAAREARLKQALRENLKRRKAQSRERSQAASSGEERDGGGAPTGEPGATE